MSLDIRAVRVLTNTSLGTQDITISGFGTPKAAMFYLSYADAGNEVIDGALIGIGATDGTNQWCFAANDEHGQATSDPFRTQDSNSCIAFPLFAGGSLDGEAQFDSWITDGVRIDWTNDMSAARFMVVVLYGGSDIDDVTVGIGTANPTQNNSVTITTGHPNDLVLFACVGLSSDADAGANNIFNTGIAINDGSDTQRMMAMSSPTGQATTALFQSVRTDSAMGQLHNGSWTWYGEVDNFTATSFDVITRNGGSASDDFGYIAFDFSANVNKSLTTVDSPTATGDEATTGIGFESSFLMMLGSPCTAVNNIQSTDVESFNISIINDSEVFSVGFQSEDNVGTTNTQSICDDVAINYDDDTGAAFFDATFTSFDSDGWTLNYSAADGTIRKWVALALGITGGVALTRSISDSIGITDNLSLTGTFIRSISDTVGLTDVLAKIGTYKRSIADSIGVTDVLSSVILIIKSIADTVGITSVLAKIGVFKRSIADTLGITDAVSRIGTFKRSITDTIGISDVLSRVGTFFRIISDTIGLTDVLTSSAAILLKIINKLSNISTGKSIGSRISTVKEVDSTITTEVEKDAEL